MILFFFYQNIDGALFSLFSNKSKYLGVSRKRDCHQSGDKIQKIPFLYFYPLPLYPNAWADTVFAQNLGASMSFLKFLSIASLSLLFLENVAAECVDLSGTYSCEGVLMTLTKTSDKEGLHAYTSTTYGIENPVVLAFDESAGSVTSTTTCTENQIETKQTSSNDGTLTLIFALLDEQTLATHAMFVEPSGRIVMGPAGTFCYKQ